MAPWLATLHIGINNQSYADVVRRTLASLLRVLTLTQQQGLDGGEGKVEETEK